MPPPASTPAWQALADHHRAAAGSHLRDLLGDDKRTEALTFALGGLCLDLSKNRLTPDTLALLIALADERGVAARRDAMAAGEAINTTEDRAALHMALRGRAEDGFAVGGTPVQGEVQAVLDHMADFGRIVTSGCISNYNDETPPPGPNNLNLVISRSLRMQGFVMMNYMAQAGKALKELSGWVNAGDIAWREDIKEGFENIPATLQRLYTGANEGKQLLKLADADMTPARSAARNC